MFLIRIPFLPPNTYAHESEIIGITKSGRFFSMPRSGVAMTLVWHFVKAQKNGDKVAGQPIRDLVTVNGVRVTCEDGSWGLVRASSNKPELVVVVESPVSEQRMHDMFEAVNIVLRQHPEVGAYNQTI